MNERMCGIEGGEKTLYVQKGKKAVAEQERRRQQ